ncbi:hypothetical protein BGX26_010088 [Mortierella sp. AD094]|nr:hypothetical protein BGX26_010088 [Mortierella sp. AD094]
MTLSITIVSSRKLLISRYSSGQSIDKDNDHINFAPAEPTGNGDTVVSGENIGTDTGYNDYDHQTTPTNQPDSIPATAGSTASIHPKISEATTQVPDLDFVETVVVHDSHAASSEASSGPAATSPQEAVYSESNPQNTQTTKISTSTTTITPTHTGYPHAERHIPSYEQWRKQVLDKKKPAEANERKQRKRKPYQESAVDVAIGSEDEIGFVFPHLDNGVGDIKSGDDRFQHASDSLGNGPDLKQELGSEKNWIKAEYAKDPKDRFNHASATCAASVVKASKDATSITAILNEGKDHYMLNKCGTKEKFFVVELCEEILVDTFVLGNYEFFSSTFKDFVVSVNRYPPRDDGWSILGHFQARNTRDAQVFKPADPQLATYIRFDFVNHYGNEYYCPVTLLRVYGATALEQLKQEEEEEKRIAEEEKRLAELEKARQAEADAEDAEEIEDIDIEEIEESIINIKKENRTEDIELTDGIKGDPESSSNIAGTPESQPEFDQILPHGDPKLPKDDARDHAGPVPHGQESEDLHKDSVNGQTEVPLHLEHTGAGSPSLSIQDGDKTAADGEETSRRDEPTSSQAALPETTLVAFEDTILTSTVHEVPETFPPRVSTSPASIHDDGDWANEDLGMITLSPKARPTQPPKQPGSSKTSSGGVGTAHIGPSSATDTSSHPVPSPHSSQESVYKNIVNRLKVLELNSSLSYQYLEEQSNIFNEILESSEQKINQLVSHLNEATRRLETLGRKYDQLAYSYRAHVEVDGEKRRQEFVNLSTQVHLLVSQLRAISGHRHGVRSNDIASTVRIGSVEGLTQFDQNSLLLRHASEGIKLTPPISPISPLTPNPNHSSEPIRLESREIPIDESSRPDSGTSLQNGEFVGDGHYTGESHLPSHSHSELGSSVHKVDPSSLKLVTSSQLDHFQVSRAPFPTPKSSFGPVRPFLHPNHSNPPHQPAYQSDYRPDSPVFQGPSGVHDEGQLSDADVAYMSRDMNVGRKGFTSAGSIPISPAMRRLSTGYSNHTHHPTAATSSRPLSSLRMDTTASLADLARSEASNSTDTLHQSPDDLLYNGASAHNDENKRESQGNGDITTGTPEMNHKELGEDVGFVSDSVLDSASEKLVESRDQLISASRVLDDWDRVTERGESGPRHESGDEDSYLRREPSKTRSRGNTLKSTDLELAADIEAVNDRTNLSRESSLKSRRRSSHNILRSLDYATNASHKNQSASATIGLGAIGLGLGGVGPDTSNSLLGSQGEGVGQTVDNGLEADEDSTMPQSQGYLEKRKKNRKPSLPDDQTVPRRRVSYGRRESDNIEATEELMYERGQDGDDERSPQVPRKSSY